ncbi:MAG: NAD(P)-dependent oxidoreductase [Acidobacteria bacterium]|nr:NAD(P)-dependent oxidoreductase [Acidobacteriota bacterium]
MSMQQPRTLLIGASGQVGSALEAEFSHESLVAASHTHARPGDTLIDLGDHVALQKTLRDVQPDLVLVAGAMCNAERCEVDPETCERINTTGPATVAEYARASGARVVFFSTDHVFDGARDCYVEEDTPRPLYVYARSKARAEALIRAMIPERHLIIRTGWVYGPDIWRRNFALRLVDRMASGEKVVVPSDQWGSPTHTEDVARATRFLVERDAVGVFHATGPEFLSRVTLALKICETFGFEPGAIEPRPTHDMGQIARRSLRVRLDCDKLRQAGAAPFRSVTDGLSSLRLSAQSRGPDRRSSDAQRTGSLEGR